MKASDNQFPSVLLAEGAAPADPPAGTQRLFVDSADHAVKTVDSAGIVHPVNSAPVTSVDGQTGAVDLKGTYLTGRTGVYMPSDWGQFWKPKRDAALAGTGKATVAFVGDSVTRGYYASRLDKGWAGLVTTALRGANGSVSDGGSGFQSMADTEVFMQSRGLTSGQTAFWASGGTNEFVALTGTWTADAPGASGVLDGPAAAYLKGSAGASATFAVRGTTVKVYGIVPLSGQTVTITIDGSPNTFNLPASGIWTAVYSGLSTGAHTVVVTCTTVNGNWIYLSGVSGENASGLVANNFGVGGARSVTMSNLTGAQSGVTVSSVSGTFGPAGTWTGGPNYPADLVIYAHGLNDLSGTVPIDTYANYVERFLNAVKGAGLASAATGATDIVIFAPAWGKFDSAQVGAEYSQRLRGLAEHYGAALIDCNPALIRNSYAYGSSLSYWSGGAAAPGTVGSDNGHPSDQGHALMKSLLYPYLTAT